MTQAVNGRWVVDVKRGVAGYRYESYWNWNIPEF
jgi:hypothetical protein